MVDDLMFSFHTHAEQVGHLSAMTLYSYAIFQIPAGVIADKIGVRRTVLGSLFCCILGILIFSSTEHLWIAKIGKILLGTGSAAAFLCVSKVSATHFSPSKRATLFGLTMAIGTLGALNGSIPLTFLISKVGWRMSLQWIALLGGIVFFINFFFLKEKRPVKSISQATDLPLITPSWQDFFWIFKQKPAWINAATALGMYLAISVVADLWGVAFITSSYGYSKAEAAATVSWIYAGLFIGSLVLTTVSDYFHVRNRLIQASGFLICAMLFLVIFYPALPKFTLALLFFGIGFFSGSEMLCFTNASENADIAHSGTTTGFVNFVVMLGGAFIQGKVGERLDYFWRGSLDSQGMRLYSTESFQNALSIIAITIGICALISFFLPKEDRGLSPLK